MDPDVTLDWLRNELKPELLDMEGDAKIEWDAVIQLFQALDEWLSKGGFLPKAWRQVRDLTRQGKSRFAGYDFAGEFPRMTNAQRDRLWEMCGNYGVAFNEADYQVQSLNSSMQPGWVEGWIGGKPGTIYTGVSPEGQSHT